MRMPLKPIAGSAVLLLIVFAAAVPSGAAEPPKAVRIASLEKLYGPVAFDHAMHVDAAPNCAACHHHTVGDPPKSGACAGCHDTVSTSGKVACESCHAAEPFSSTEVALSQSGGKRYHIDKPGLKGAYHRACRGCHEREGAPVGCGDCHKRNAAGDAFFSAGAASKASGADRGTHN